MLKENSVAPDFSLADQDYIVQKLSDYKGQWVALYFYPLDESPGCTKEAQNFRDNLKKFKELNVKIIGVNQGSVESHKNFVQNHNLQFTLLSDPEKEVISKYQ